MSLAIKDGIYRHYKNEKLYLVTNIAKHSETEEEMVIYHSLYENSYWHGPWVRPIEIFEDRQYTYFRGKGHTLKLCNSCMVYISRGRLKERAVKYKGSKCEKCGYNKCIASLCFHHTNPKQKDFEISKSHYFKWEEVKKELDKCSLLCINCHNEIHYINTKHYDFISKTIKIKNRCKKCNSIISRGASICAKCYKKIKKPKSSGRAQMSLLKW